MPAPGKAASFAARLWAQISPELKLAASTPIFRIIAALFVAYSTVAFAMFNGRGIEFTLFAYISLLFQPIAIIMFALLYLGWPRSVKDKLARFYHRDFVISGFLLVVVTLFFHSVFLTFKTSFTDFVPFWADETLMRADRAIHFGKTPWEFIAPIFSNAAVIYAIDFLYTFWLLINLFVILQQAFASKSPELRATFFLCYYIVWIVLGTVIALAASSAGPCYFQYVSSLPNPYDAQMAFLDHLDKTQGVNALAFKNVLWENHAQGKGGIINGISAFPSIHVAMAVVFALLGRHYGRVARWASYFYLAVIMVGSVTLNWHYAVDGYASMIMTPMVWFFSSWAVKRYKLAVPRA